MLVVILNNIMTRRSWIAVGLAFSLTETSCFGFQVMQPACFFSKRSALNMAADLPEMQDIPSMEPFAHDTPKVTTTEIQDGVNITTVVSDDDLLPLAPPLTFDKFITMQVLCQYCVVVFMFTQSRSSNCLHVACLLV